MADLGELTLDDFAGRVGESFTVGPLFDPQGQPVTVEILLGSAEALGDAPGDGRRTPFSLIFTGPPELVFQQGVHPIEHEELGTFEPFLVPIQPEEGRALYQAIFT